MLRVPVIGSSTEKDTRDELLIDSTKIEKWKNGGLNDAEIYLSQFESKIMMQKFTYDLKKFRFPPPLTLFYLLTFPIKLVLAFLLNFKRIGNVVEVVKKRFFAK